MLYCFLCYEYSGTLTAVEYYHYTTTTTTTRVLYTTTVYIYYTTTTTAAAAAATTTTTILLLLLLRLPLHNDDYNDYCLQKCAPRTATTTATTAILVADDYTTTTFATTAGATIMLLRLLQVCYYTTSLTRAKNYNMQPRNRKPSLDPDCFNQVGMLRTFAACKRHWPLTTLLHYLGIYRAYWVSPTHITQC